MSRFTTLETSPDSAAAKPTATVLKASLTLCLTVAAVMLAACNASAPATPIQPASEPTVTVSAAVASNATATPTQLPNATATFIQTPDANPSSLSAQNQAISVKQVLEKGLPQNKSEIRIQFPHAIANPNIARFTVISQMINLPGEDTVEIQIPVDAINIDNDGRTLVITTGRLVSQGGKVIISNDALLDVNGNFIPGQQITLTTGATSAEATMGQRPFAPTDPDFYTATTVTPAEVSPEAARTGLSNYLDKNSSFLHHSKQQLMDWFDSNELKTKVPNANTRAGLLSLSATSAHMAIDAVVNGDITIRNAQEGEAPDIRIARTIPLSNGKALVLFNSNYKNEPLQMLGAVLAHEIIVHTTSSPDVGLAEEVVGNTVTAIIAMEMLIQEPDLAQSKTPLLQFQRKQILALLNSGEQFPNIGVNQVSGISDVLPGSGKTFRSFVEYVASLYPNTGDYPSEATPEFHAWLRGFLQSNEPLLDNLDYHPGLYEILDLQQMIRSEDAVRLAQILHLKPADPTTTSTANNN